MKGARAEKGKKADAKLSVKKKAAEKPRATKRGKAAKDPNKPKRPPSAFFVFMEDFRKAFKEKNPNNKSVSVVGKAGGDKWKTLSEAEKAPFVAKANKLKSEYNSKMNAYNKKQVIEIYSKSKLIQNNCGMIMNIIAESLVFLIDYRPSLKRSQLMMMRRNQTNQNLKSTMMKMMRKMRRRKKMMIK